MRERFSTIMRGGCLIIALAGLLLMTIPTGFASAKTDTIKLRYGSYSPRGIIDDPILWFFEEVSKRSGVKIKLEPYFSGTLAKPMDCLDAIGYRAYDVGWISPAFTPGKTPLAMILGSTPLVAQSIYSMLSAADEVVRTCQPVMDEFLKAKVKFLFHTGVGQYELISTKPVKSLENIKGLRVRTFGYQAKAWAELGGTPVTIPITDAYDALQKGVVDGVLTQPFSMYKGLRLYEVAKNFTKVDFGCLPAPVVMNVDAWNELPENVKKEMVALVGGIPAEADKFLTNPDLSSIEGMKKEGVAIYDLSPEDKARIQETGQVIAQSIVADFTAKGVSGAKDVMDMYLKALEKYEKE